MTAAVAGRFRIVRLLAKEAPLSVIARESGDKVQPPVSARFAGSTQCLAALRAPRDGQTHHASPEAATDVAPLPPRLFTF